jgi:hypothetical protein
MPTPSTARPSKIYPNWDFWFENIPSGNPGPMELVSELVPEDIVEEEDRFAAKLRQRNSMFRFYREMRPL